MVTKLQREGAGLTLGRRVQDPERQLWVGGSVDPGPSSWSWLQEAVTREKFSPLGTPLGVYATPTAQSRALPLPLPQALGPHSLFCATQE